MHMKKGLASRSIWGYAGGAAQAPGSWWVETRQMEMMENFEVKGNSSPSLSLCGVCLRPPPVTYRFVPSSVSPRVVSSRVWCEEGVGCWEQSCRIWNFTSTFCRTCPTQATWPEPVDGQHHSTDKCKTWFRFSVENRHSEVCEACLTKSKTPRELSQHLQTACPVGGSWSWPSDCSQESSNKQSSGSALIRCTRSHCCPGQPPVSRNAIHGMHKGCRGSLLSWDVPADPALKR